VGGGVRRSVGDVSLIEQLKRLKANEHGLVEFKTPPSMMQQELQATTSDLIRIISDCLVFNTHLLVPPPPPPLLEEHSGHPAHTHTHTHMMGLTARWWRARAQRLDLSGCEMKEAEAKMLAEALRVNSTVEYLSIAWCNLSDTGATAIAGPPPSCQSPDFSAGLGWAGLGWA